MKKHISTKKKNIIWSALSSILIAFSMLLLVVIIGVYGNKNSLLTQISTIFFASLAPFVIIISILNLIISGVGFKFTDGKISKKIVITSILISFLLNIVTAYAMTTWNNVVKENGGKYNFLQSVCKISPYGSDIPDEKVTYRTVDNEDLSISIYNNSENKKNLPVYIYIHGGGWTQNNADTMSGFHRYFANNGFVSFSVNYRLGTDENPTWNKAIEDCAYALKWIYEHAENYGGNKDNIVVVGESAGGNLALIYSDASASGKLKEFYGIDVPVPQATCVMYPVIDIEAYAKEGLFISKETSPGLDIPYLGGTVDEYPDRTAFVSPETYITNNDPSTLIIHGEKDSLVTVEGSKSYVENSNKAGADAKLIILPYCNHASELLTNNMTHQADRTIIMSCLKEKGILK